MGVQKDMKKKSVGVNAVLNIIKQCCAIIFPLITFPYISRVLQVENYGKVNFSGSIIGYFYLFAALGIANYAVREGARIRNDKDKIQTFASEVFTINFISTIISYALLFMAIIFWGKLHAYWNILLVQSIGIILTTIGADWINSIYEDYLFITIRYIIIQFLSVCMMLLFVKKPEDYIIYASINVIASAGANIANFFHVRRYINLKITFHPHIKKHAKPILLLFCNALSMQIYVNSDMTILGALKDDYSVGIYSAAVKIYNIIKQVLTAAITVAIPRISALLGQNDYKEYNKLLDRTFHAIVCLVMPAIVGIYMLSYEIICVIGSERYAQGYWTLRILSLALAGAVFANFFNNAILLPNKKEKFFLQATIIAALINISLNFILIPKISYLGAASTTVLAEFIVLFLGVYHARGLYDFKISKRDIISCFFGCLIIILVCEMAKKIIAIILIRIVVSIIFSILLYTAILVLFRNRMAQIIIVKMKKILRKGER